MAAIPRKVAVRCLTVALLPAALAVELAHEWRRRKWIQRKARSARWVRS